VGMNWTPQTQEITRLRHAELIRDATRRHALLRNDERPVERPRAPRSPLMRLFSRLSPAA